MCDGEFTVTSSDSGDTLQCSGNYEQLDFYTVQDVDSVITPEDFTAVFFGGFGLVVAMYAMIFPIKAAKQAVKKL